MTHYSGSIPTTPRKPNWRDNAACIGANPELFHAGERDPHATEEARTICGRCTVRTACLIAAYQEDDQHGLRAGLTHRQRNTYLRKAEGDITRAVAEALETTAILLQQIYRHHAKPAPGGHMVWTDHRHLVTVRGVPYTPARLAWIAFHGTEPIGQVKRACQVEGCVAKACLTDRWMRDRAAAARKRAEV